MNLLQVPKGIAYCGQTNCWRDLVMFFYVISNFPNSLYLHSGILRPWRTRGVFVPCPSTRSCPCTRWPAWWRRSRPQARRGYQTPGPPSPPWRRRRCRWTAACGAWNRRGPRSRHRVPCKILIIIKILFFFGVTLKPFTHPRKKWMSSLFFLAINGKVTF